MIRLLSTLSLFVSLNLSLSAVTLAQTSPTIVTPATVEWTAGTGPFAGTQVAILEGDPSKPGPYTVRVKIRDGGRFAPHSHADIEHVTVIAGTSLVGLGDTMDVSKLKALDAGSYVIIPSRLHHFAMAKADTIIQIHGMGPSTFDMLAHAK